MSAPAPSSTSAASSPSSSPPLPPPFQPHPSFVASHTAMGLLLANRFTDLRAFYSAEAPKNLYVASLACWLAVIEAATSPDPTQLGRTLEEVWKVEYRARWEKVRGRGEGSTGGKGIHPAAQQLVQADTYTLGGVVQLLMESYIKAAWNIRKGWNFYSAALQLILASEVELSLQQTPHPEAIAQWNADKQELQELRSWAEFGEGIFQVVVSLLPPTVATITSWVGFSGDRQAGLEHLRSSAFSPTVMAPFSAAMKANFLISLVTYSGEKEEVYMPVIDAILAHSDASNWKESFTLILLHSRKCRHLRQLPEAIRLANECIRRADSGGLPQLAMLLHVHSGWCSFFLVNEWDATSAYFDRMIHTERYGAFDPEADYVTKRARWTPAQISALDKSKRVPPSRINSQPFYALLVGLCEMQRYLEQEGERRKEQREKDAQQQQQQQAVQAEKDKEKDGDQPGAASSDSFSPPRSGAFRSPPSFASRASFLCLNRAYFYLQTALSLVDPARVRPMDHFTTRKAQELLQRAGSEVEGTMWLDTAELLLKWNAAQQMSPEQLHTVIGHLEASKSHGRDTHSLEHRAAVQLYLANMRRGLGSAEDRAQARKDLDAFMAFSSALAVHPESRTSGILAFAYYESAILYYDAGNLDQARAANKQAKAQPKFDLYNAVQVRCHALTRMIKEARKAKEFQID